MDVLKAVLFGMVEGVTEWLPVSSTGHMILLDEFVRLDVSASFYSMFQVVIQLGAILAVVLFFRKDYFPAAVIKNETGHFVPVLKKDKLLLWQKILAACMPAAAVGLLWNEKLEAMFFNYRTVAVMLIAFGLAFLVIEDMNQGKVPKAEKVEDITWNMALLIGCFQLIAAVFPGTSRSGATIAGALLLGVSRVAAAEFTFYLAIPVMFGASLLKLLHFGWKFTPRELTVLTVGMTVAFLVSAVVIQFLMEYVRKHDFRVFGWYRIALGVAVLVYFGI